MQRNQSMATSKRMTWVCVSCVRYGLLISFPCPATDEENIKKIKIRQELAMHGMRGVCLLTGAIPLPLRLSITDFLYFFHSNKLFVRFWALSMIFSYYHFQFINKKTEGRGRKRRRARHRNRRLAHNCGGTPHERQTARLRFDRWNWKLNAKTAESRKWKR